MKSVADDSHFVNQGLVLFWEFEPLLDRRGESHCASSENLFIFLCQHQPVRSDRESGRPVGRSQRGHLGAPLLVFQLRAGAVVPKGFCIVFL